VEYTGKIELPASRTAILWPFICGMFLLAFARQYAAGLHSPRALQLHETAWFLLREI
jgi:hypothetical protein